MSGTSSPNLRLLTLNVNGLRSSPEKRRQLFHGLRQGNFDIICLQETHHSCEAEAQKWLQEGSGPGSAWLGPSFWCHYTTASRGVAILFTATLPFTEMRRVHSDLSGRTLRVDFTIHGTAFTVGCVYAPSVAAERPQFFSQLHSQFQTDIDPVTSHTTADRDPIVRIQTPAASSVRSTIRRCLLVGGDFNCVSDRTIDRIAIMASSTSPLPDRGYPELHSCMQILGLTDTWRQHNPTQRAFTYVSTDECAGSRIDRWLTCTSTHAEISGHGFIDNLVGDHRGVLIRVTPADGIIQGRGSWKLPASMLADQDFGNRLRGRLTAFQHKHPLSASAEAALFLTTLSHPPPPITITPTPTPPAPPPSTDSAPSPYPHPLSEPLNARDRFDGLVDVIYTTAMTYQLELQNSRRREQVVLLRAVTQAAAAATRSTTPAATALHDYKAAQQALQDHGLHEARNAAARAAVVYRDYAEAPTFYFHATHGRGEPHTRLLTSVEAEPNIAGGPNRTINLTSHENRLAAAAAITEFYSSDNPGGLFRPGDVDVAAQDSLLADIDRTLSPADRTSCEGVFSVDELHAALQTLPRGKAPGSDGIPYELYTSFWPELGQPLCDALNESFAQSITTVETSASETSSSQYPHPPTLTQRQRTGSITIIYKGKGSPAQLSNYRPITLFNADIKIAAKALARRFSHPLASVVDNTQTAYIPGRWAGDNVICHMEEVDYAAATGEPGAILFLDFAKAFDRLHRGWLLRSLDTMGFGPDACCWVSTMLAGSQARVAFNGWLTDDFPTAGGVGQGSPLSALLYVAAAQPLAARARRLQAAGHAVAITMPNGCPAPPTHQHADDTTLHGRSVADVAVLFNRAVTPFCEASGARINISKTRGITFGDGASPAAFIDPDTNIQYVSATTTIRHLGIEIGANTAATAAARDKQLHAKLGIIGSRIATWSRHNLSYFGRVYVARQVLAATLAYHFTFLPSKPATLKAIKSAIHGYVRRSPNSPTDNHLFQPAARITTLPFRDGGVRLPDLDWAPVALSAKYATRLLEPAAHPWKIYAESWLRRDASWTAAHPDIATRDIDFWGLGKAALISTFNCNTIPGLPQRVRAALTAFQTLQPHRLKQAADLCEHQVLREPLFYNRQITNALDQPLGGERWQPLAAAGITRVGDLLTLIASGAPTQMLSLAQDAHACLPPPWRTPQLSPPTGDTRISPDSTRVVVVTPGTTQHQCQTIYTVNVDSSLALTPGSHVSDTHPPTPPDATWRPCLLSRWSPSRSWRVTDPIATSSAPSATTLYLVQPWADVQLDPAIWGCGPTSLIRLTVSGMSQRMRVIHLISKPPNGAEYLIGHPVRPKVWEDDWNSASPNSTGIRREEQRWEISAQAKVSAGLYGTPFQDGTSLMTASSHAPWMQSPPPRLHPRDRIAANTDQSADISPRSLSQPNPPEPADDTIDIAHPAPGVPPWATVYRAIGDRSLPREHRIIAWRLLHGFLPCGAFLMHVSSRPSNTTYKASRCSHPACSSAPANLTHIFTSCNIAKAVVGWLCAVWATVEPGNKPPASFAVIAVGDPRAWTTKWPQLWLRLRLRLLHELWRSHSVMQHATDQQSAPASSIARRIILGAAADMRLDWLRASMSAHVLADACGSWMTGGRRTQTPAEARETFRQLWCQNDILCQLPPTGAASPLIRWSTNWPVPLPATQPD